MIRTDCPAHLSGDAARAEVREVIHGTAPILSDAAALTIASWWQSPGRVGVVFAQLSTIGAVDAAELADAAEAMRGNLVSGILAGEEDDALRALILWTQDREQD